MSGTGIIPIREIRGIGVVGVVRLVAAVQGRLRIVRRRGGLAVPVAVPVAVLVTAVVVLMTVSAASTWVPA
jgi:hypothetical protein